MKKTFLYMAIGLVGVAACGGGGSSVTRGGPAAPAVETVGVGIPATTQVTFDSAGAGEVTINVAGSNTTLDSEVAVPIFPFNGYDDGLGINRALVAQSTSGDGQLIVVSALSAGGRFSGTFLQRFGTTNIPSSGDVNYAGPYAALVTNNATGDLVATIEGDVLIDVDFAQARVDGLIEGRTVALAGEQFDLADVTLQDTSLSDGSFSGSTSGGAIDEANAVAAAGEYGGLITGPTGLEMIGGVQMMHDRDGDALTEIGGFVADQ